jgi:hypothetical protein
VREEPVALLGLLLGAGLKHLDGARDHRERRPQLVGRVGDELPLRTLAALALRDVSDHDHGDVRLERRDSGNRVDVVDVRRRARLDDVGLRIE